MTKYEKCEFGEMLDNLLNADSEYIKEEVEIYFANRFNLRRNISSYALDLQKIKDSLNDDTGINETTFAEDVVSLCEEQGIITPTQFSQETYVNANIFIDMKKNKKYIPSKRNICISLCVGLRLTYAEALVLLKKAGIILSKLIDFDNFIIKYSLEPRFYDIEELNGLLNELYPNDSKMVIGSGTRGTYKSRMVR